MTRLALLIVGLTRRSGNGEADIVAGPRIRRQAGPQRSPKVRAGAC